MNFTVFPHCSDSKRNDGAQGDAPDDGNGKHDTSQEDPTFIALPGIGTQWSTGRTQGRMSECNWGIECADATAYGNARFVGGQDSVYDARLSQLSSVRQKYRILIRSVWDKVTKSPSLWKLRPSNSVRATNSVASAKSGKTFIASIICLH